MAYLDQKRFHGLNCVVRRSLGQNDSDSEGPDLALA